MTTHQSYLMVKKNNFIAVLMVFIFLGITLSGRPEASGFGAHYRSASIPVTSLCYVTSIESGSWRRHPCTSLMRVPPR